MPRSLLLPLLWIVACAGPPASPLGRYTQSNLVVDGSFRIHYQSSGEGPTTLVVPGGSAIGPDLQPLSSECRLVWYDGRGEGRSDRIEDTNSIGLERDVEDLERLRQHLDVDRMSLLAWSYHAGVAAHYASRYPQHVERLILVAPIPLQREPYWRRFRTAIARRLGPEGRRALIDIGVEGRRRDCAAISSIVLPVYFVDPTAIAKMRGAPCVPPNDDPEHVNRQRLVKIERLGDWNWSELLGGILAPAIVLPGHPDLIHWRSSELWASCLGNGRLVSLGEVGHYPWLEAPERFFALVSEFLAAGP